MNYLQYNEHRTATPAPLVEPSLRDLEYQVRVALMRRRIEQSAETEHITLETLKP